MGPLEGSARELMAVEQMDAAGEAIEDAETFLADSPRDSPVANPRDSEGGRNAHGHTWRTVERAKKSLGVVARKGGLERARMVLGTAAEDRQPPGTKTAN